MKKKTRIREAIKFLIGSGVAKNHQEIAKLMGYKNASSLSHILHGKTTIPKMFIDKICLLNKQINKEWITNGEGAMILENEPTTLSTSKESTCTTFYQIYKDQLFIIKEKDLKIEELTKEIIILKENARILKQQLTNYKLLKTESNIDSKNKPKKENKYNTN